MMPLAQSSSSQTQSPTYAFFIDLANTFKAFIGLNFIVVAYGFSKAGLVRGVIGLIIIALITEHCCLLLIQVKNSLYQQQLPTVDPATSSTSPNHQQHSDNIDNADDTSSSSDQQKHHSNDGVDEQQQQKHQIDTISVGPPSNNNAVNNDDQQKTQDGPTFGDVALRVGGKNAERFIVISVIATQFGYCVGYFIFISQTLHDLVRSSLPVPFFILVPYPILTAMSLLVSIRSLGPFSAFANGALLCGFIAVVAFIIRHFNWTPTHVPLTSFPMFFGQMTAAIEGIGLVIPLEASMRQKKNFPLILRITLALLTVILMMVGVLGFATFGKDTKSIILLNFDVGSVVTAVKAVLIIGILFTYPLQIIPVFEFAERLFIKEVETNENVDQNSDGKEHTVSDGISSTSSVAIRLQEEDDKSGNVRDENMKTTEEDIGSKFRVLDEDDDELIDISNNNNNNNANNSNINIKSNNNHNHNHNHNHNIINKSDENQAQTDKNNKDNKSDSLTTLAITTASEQTRSEEQQAQQARQKSIFIKDRRRIMVRFGVVTLTAVTAVVTGTSFGVFNSLVGSLGASMLAYTAPALLHSWAFWDEIPTSVKMKNGAIAAFGMFGAVSGTMSALWEIVEIHRGNSTQT